MALKLKGSTSGFTAIDAPATAGDNTLVLPADNGSPSQYLQTNGSGVLSWATVTDTGATWKESTASSLSGASQEWTGIPSDARQIIITHQGWSNASSSQHWCQIGDSGGFETTGYYNGNVYVSSSTGATDYDNQSAFIQGQATDPSTEVTGTIVLSRLNTSNQWTIVWHYSPSNGAIYMAVGNKSLSGTLDRVRILPSTGNLDAGIANLMYLS